MGQNLKIMTINWEILDKDGDVIESGQACCFGPTATYFKAIDFDVNNGFGGIGLNLDRGSSYIEWVSAGDRKLLDKIWADLPFHEWLKDRYTLTKNKDIVSYIHYHPETSMKLVVMASSIYRYWENEPNLLFHYPKFRKLGIAPLISLILSANTNKISKDMITPGQYSGHMTFPYWFLYINNLSHLLDFKTEEIRVLASMQEENEHWGEIIYTGRDSLFSGNDDTHQKNHYSSKELNLYRKSGLRINMSYLSPMFFWTSAEEQARVIKKYKETNSTYSSAGVTYNLQPIVDNVLTYQKQRGMKIANWS